MSNNKNSFLPIFDRAELFSEEKLINFSKIYNAIFIVLDLHLKITEKTQVIKIVGLPKTLFNESDLLKKRKIICSENLVCNSSENIYNIQCDIDNHGFITISFDSELEQGTEILIGPKVILYLL